MTRMMRPWVKKNNYSWLILPLIVAFIVIIIIIRLLTSSTWDSQVKNWSYLNVSLNQEKSQIYLYMSEDSKKKIEWSEKLYSTDNKIEVESWEAKITPEQWNTKVYLNKLWELSYAWKKNNIEVINLKNWEAWIESDWEINFELKNFKVLTSWQNVLALSQNMMASSIYVLKWEVSIELSWKTNNTTIWVWQKLTILNTDLNEENLSIQEKIEPIDDFFKEWELYIKHNWSSYSWLPTDSWSWSEDWSWSISKQNSKTLLFTYPSDEESVDSNTINIEGKISSTKVEKITINDKEVSINREENTFVAKDFQLQNDINNLVYKAYDQDGNLLVKWVLTVYSTSKEKAVESQEKPTVTTYPISSKDFRIISPDENPYKTTENLVKIAWVVNRWAVKFITINDFRLTKFTQYSSNWYYFANKDYGTMNDWINLYTIKYYWKDDELLYTSLFTIVKETIEIENPITTSWSVSSSWSTEG